jgi:hypothetical protein
MLSLKTNLTHGKSKKNASSARRRSITRAYFHSNIHRESVVVHVALFSYGNGRVYCGLYARIDPALP